MKSDRGAKEANSDDFIAAAERAFNRVARKRRAENRALKATIRNPLKVPFGTAKFCRLRNARYLRWEDAFEIDFEDGLSFLEPHATIRKANKISEKASVQSVELEDEFQHGFFVHYDNGQTAEVSWSFIRELPPKGNDKSLLDEMEETVISAIKNKHVLSFFYDDAIRTVEPQTYGISTAGHPVLRGYHRGRQQVRPRDRTATL